MATTYEATRNVGSKVGEKSKELAHKTEGKLRAGGDEFKDQAYRAGSKIAEKSKELAYKTENEIKGGESMLQDQAYRMGAKAREYLGDCKEKLEDGASYLEGQIKAHPFVATGTALIVGMLISRLFDRNK